MEKPSPIRELSPRIDRRWTLGIFVKEPVPGQVKTRLVPPLTPTEAVDLYRVALEETVRRMTAGPFRVVLFHAGSADFFRRSFPGLPLRSQLGESLGERMEQALDSLLAEGASAAGIVGSDSPDLPLTLVVEAFAALEQAEAVTIPAADGGYVFIGTTRPLPQLFSNIPWSTGDVGRLTRSRAEQAKIRYCECGSWDDFDDLAALQRLVRRSPDSATARHASAQLKEKLTLSR